MAAEKSTVPTAGRQLDVLATGPQDALTVVLHNGTPAGLMAARQAAIETAADEAGRPGPTASCRVRVLRTVPYRPRPKTLPPPPGASPRDRLLALTGALSDRTPPRVVRASPEEAADELIRYLKDQGYLG